MALADFSVPDTVCYGYPVLIQNLSQDATTYYWNFCSGNTYYQPLAENIGDPGSLDEGGMYITAVKDSMEYFTFMTSTGNSKLIRHYYGSSYNGFPVNNTDLGNFGLLDGWARGIQVKKDNGSWYGFVINKTKLVRLYFGTSLLNNPVATSSEIPNMSAGAGLVICKEGTDWFGFCPDEVRSILYRIEFGNSLAGTPQYTELGNIRQLNGPTTLAIAKQNGIWYSFITNTSLNTLTRLVFQQGLTQPPVGSNMGSLPGFDNIAGISLVTDCGKVHGYLSNFIQVGTLVHLVFENGLGGPVTTFLIPSIGILNKPYGISEIIRIGDSLYGFIANYGSSTITRLIFPICNEASIPSYTGSDPPPFFYSSSGNYNIQLVINEGTAQQSVMCKNIVVLPATTVNLGPDRTVCNGTAVVLDAGPGGSIYEWSTGATTRVISVDSSGTYSVRVEITGQCDARDTVIITVVPSVENNIDTATCFNQPYFAQGEWRTISGVYHDTLTSYMGCDSIIHTTLHVEPRPPLDLGRDTILCPDNTLVLDATVPDTTTYLWQDGTTNPTLTVSQPGIYWVHLFVNGCLSGDTIKVHTCPYTLWFPSAFSPNGDGLNDNFKPAGISIAVFKMEIFNRWGAKVFETNNINEGWDGRINAAQAPAGTYTYRVDFEVAEADNTVHHKSGVFVLVR